MKTNISARINRNFANEVSRLSAGSGVELYVARNILRFRRALRTQPKKVWMDPKTGLALTRAQWESPSQKLYRKATMGTGATIENPDYPDLTFKGEWTPDESWVDAVNRGMFNNNGTLMTEIGYTSMIFDAPNPFDHEPVIVTESVFEAKNE